MFPATSKAERRSLVILSGQFRTSLCGQENATVSLTTVVRQLRKEHRTHFRGYGLNDGQELPHIGQREDRIEYLALLSVLFAFING